MIPSEPQLSAYKEEIQKLSERFGTARFSPHLTLGKLPDDFSDREISLYLKTLISSGNKPFSANHTHTECRSSPYQNLIQSLDISDSLARFQFELEELLPGYRPKEEYHISLMYGKIPCNTLSSLKTEVSDRLPGKILFSKISVIELNGPPDLWNSLLEQEI